MSLEWNHSFRQPKLGPIDGRIVFMIPLLVFKFNVWTIGLTLLIALFLWIISTRGYTLEATARLFRSTLAGRYRYGKAAHQRRYLVDYSPLPGLEAADQYEVPKK